VDSQVAVLYTGHHPPGITLTTYVDGVVLAVVDDGLLLDKSASLEFRRQLVAVAKGPFVVVGDLRGVPFIDREARAVFAGDEGGMLLATAVVVGREGPMRLLTERWLADHDVRRPIATFSERADALAWARSKAVELRAAGRFG
jgi:hypothetical protein